MQSKVRGLMGGISAVSVLALVACGSGRAPANDAQAAQDRAACSLAGKTSVTPLTRTSSQVALARSGGRTLALVADEDTQRIHVVDLDTKKELSSVALDSPPAGMVIAKSGRVAVALPRRGQVRVLSLDGVKLSSGCAVDAPAEPVALALTPDDETLLVTSAWGRALTAYSTASMSRRFEIDLPREPRAVSVDEDGKRAFVAHGVGGVMSVVDLTSQRARQVNLNTPVPAAAERSKKALERALEQSLKTTPDEQKVLVERVFARQLAALDKPARVANQGFALAVSVEPQGRIFVPHVEVDPGSPDQRTTGYGSGGQAAATPAVAVIDSRSLEPQPQTVEPPVAWVNAPLLAGREACRLPRAAAVDPGSGLLLVTCVGSDTLIGYDAASPNPIDAEVKRIRVPAGPTGLAVDDAGRRAVIWSQFERAISVIPLGRSGQPLQTDEPKPVRIDLQSVPGAGLSAKLALGRRLFHAVDDGRIASDGRACANCHIGGRDDGLVWSTPNGPRRTKTLAGLVHETAPYSWDGSAETILDQIEGTFERLGGQGGLHGAELEALAAYVASLPEPPRVAGESDEGLVARGARLFVSTQAGCSSCHLGAQKTDLVRHQVQSEAHADVSSSFDTPALRFLGGRAPYFHDGRYTSLGELLRASDGKMGHTAHLSSQDLAALEAYLLTL